MKSSEFARIRELARLFAPATGKDVLLGIGDDTAVVNVEANQALTVDASIEGVHFRRSFADWRTLGRRAYATAASDVAAVGATPKAALVSLILPETFTDEDLLAVGGGLADLSEEIQAPVVGGNLAQGGEVSITTTVLGSAPNRHVTRAGAKAGDRIWVTGFIGAAALGLRCLMQSGSTQRNSQPFVESWRRPVPRIAEGRALNEEATASIDVSDGLMQDLNHIAEASNVSATVHTETLPLAPHHAELAYDLGVDGIELALTGGEDYELLFTLRPQVTPTFPATCIGEIQTGQGVSAVGPDGRPFSLEQIGFNHFA